jgi:hypothetical protein
LPSSQASFSIKSILNDIPSPSGVSGSLPSSEAGPIESLGSRSLLGTVSAEASSFHNNLPTLSGSFPTESVLSQAPGNLAPTDTLSSANEVPSLPTNLPTKSLTVGNPFQIPSPVWSAFSSFFPGSASPPVTSVNSLTEVPPEPISIISSFASLSTDIQGETLFTGISSQLPSVIQSISGTGPSSLVHDLTGLSQTLSFLNGFPTPTASAPAFSIRMPTLIVLIWKDGNTLDLLMLIFLRLSKTLSVTALSISMILETATSTMPSLAKATRSLLFKLQDLANFTSTEKMGKLITCHSVRMPI